MQWSHAQSYSPKNLLLSLFRIHLSLWGWCYTLWLSWSTHLTTTIASEGSPSSFPVLCLPWTLSLPCSPQLSLLSSKAHIISLDYFFANLVMWTNSVQASECRQQNRRERRGSREQGKLIFSQFNLDKPLL